ncbi:MAG: TetR/AcrR family transcriptional regulator [Actinobacteria bacterium]|nr:TetR/AcrR family transcriptional regulator [Actinomycetota bacterium]
MAQRVDDPDTQEKLVAAAAHLFARRGIEAVPLRDVGAQAGQRNASAVQYHFGGRWDLVAAILSHHAETASPGERRYDDLSVEEIVESLVTLLRPKLADVEGRDFLRVVFELMVRYPGRWSESGPRSGLPSLVKRIESLLGDVPRRVARARAVAMTQFVTQQMAERSRLIDESERRMLGEALFAANLTQMAIAMLLAPAPTKHMTTRTTTRTTTTTRKGRRA